MRGAAKSFVVQLDAARRAHFGSDFWRRRDQVERRIAAIDREIEARWLALGRVVEMQGEKAMESKSIFQSKTVGANIATAIVMVATVANLDLSPEEATAIVGGIFTLVNVIMRLVTKGPAHVIAPKEL